jgi:hypothetical protein
MNRIRIESLNRTQFRAGGIAAAGLLIGLMLVLSTLTSSPSLHLKFCPNATTPGHHCAVTAFAGGVAGTSLTPVLSVIPCLIAAAALPLLEFTCRASPLFRLSPSRPPPFRTQFGR